MSAPRFEPGDRVKVKGHAYAARVVSSASAPGCPTSYVVCFPEGALAQCAEDELSPAPAEAATAIAAAARDAERAAVLAHLEAFAVRQEKYQSGSTWAIVVRQAIEEIANGEHVKPKPPAGVTPRGVGGQSDGG